MMKTMSPSAEQLTMKASLLKTFEQLERQQSAEVTPFLRRLRSAGIARFDQLGFPSSRDEEWRFTPLNALYRQTFTPVTSRLQIDAAGSGTVVNLPDAISVTCHDGYMLPFSATLPQGCTIVSLQQALKTRHEWLESTLGRLAGFENNTFAALNTALLQDGVVIHLARNCVVKQPIQLNFIESGRGIMCFPRILVIAEQHSQARILEWHCSESDQPGCTVAVSEFALADEARIDHYRFNDVSTESFHFVTQHSRLARGSNFRSHAFTLGGSLVRNDLFAYLGAENGECTLNGLYSVDGSRLIDNHTTIDHALPRCNSHEVYKGIIAGKGKGVFNGKIFVRQDAQKTDAKQTNQTLLLSPDAMIDTKPQLEIFADDVKCTHGATVGQLDSDMLFYLRSRGISAADAEVMLTYAFANDIISRVEIDSLRQLLEQRFLATGNSNEGS